MLTLLPNGVQTKRFFPFAIDVNNTRWCTLSCKYCISENFLKNLKLPFWDIQGLGGNWFMKYTWSRKSRDTVLWNHLSRSNKFISLFIARICKSAAQLNTQSRRRPVCHMRHRGEFSNSALESYFLKSIFENWFIWLNFRLELWSASTMEYDWRWGRKKTKKN